MGLSPLPSPPLPPSRWDLFCRVIDNHGDIGVCWRLACDLAGRGHEVRLWVDDASALAWMAPETLPGVVVLPWRAPHDAEVPGDVVVEAFGCNPPPAFVQAMARRPGCVWVNLEYLSAEAYVERSHGLASPQFSGPGAGLTKWFYYPGFTPHTGGLLREPGLLERQAAFDHAAFLRSLGIDAAPRRPIVSVFAYPHSPVDRLLSLLSRIGATVLACPGPVQALLVEQAAHYPSVQVHALPWLTQPAYDHLLWSCDLNFVRGEDSFVRAQWAAAPFVWQIYEQDDGVHADKLGAFLRTHLQTVDRALTRGVETLWHAWNRLGPWPDTLPPLPAWREHAVEWRQRLAGQTDLTTGLERFVAAQR